MSQNDFYYTAARLRTLEGKLLDFTNLERMLGAKTGEEAYKILSDIDTSTHVGDIKNVEEFQRILDANLMDTKKLLERIVPDERILDILFFPYDFHNLKTLLKGILSEKDRTEIRKELMPLGRISVEAMEEFFFNKEKNSLLVSPQDNAFIKAAVKKARSLYEKTHNPRLIDLILDQYLFEHMFQRASALKNNFVITFVQTLIDLANLKTLLRIKLLKQENQQDLDLAAHLFIAKGSVPVYKFNEAMEKDLSGLVGIFKGSHYKGLIQRTIEAYEKSHSFIALEQECNQHLIHLVQKSRYVPAGVEPVLAYFFAKQNNASLIRMIMIGKLHAIPEEQLRANLPKLYAA